MRIALALACLLAMSAMSAAPAAPRKAAKVEDKPAPCMTDEGGGRKLPCGAGGGGGGGAGGM